VREAVLNAPAGAVETAVETGGAWIAFKGTHTPERVTPLEETREQVERMYRMAKEQELVNALIQETLEARNVKIYEERLKEGAKP
jgi:parvulin-like peptidyl-prolyl isomerase